MNKELVMNTSSINIATEKNKTLAKNVIQGVVTAIRGSIVNIQFKKDLPSIFSVVRTGKKMEVVIEVQLQLDNKHVRGIALTPTQGTGERYESRPVQMSL